MMTTFGGKQDIHSFLDLELRSDWSEEKRESKLCGSLISIVPKIALIIAGLFAALFSFHSTVTAAETKTVAAIEHIDADFKSGRLTLDQKVQLQITAIRYPESLPKKYQSPTLDGRRAIATRCASTTIQEVRSVWDQLSTETQKSFSQAFSRPAGSISFISPSGFFHFHYDTTGANAVSSDDVDLNLIPDFVERCAAYADSTLTKSQSLGYFLPPSDDTAGGDSLLDIYFQEISSYGYALPEGTGPAPWNDYYAYLVLHRNFLGFAPNYDPEGDQLGSAKATIAHELHHCVQFAYDASDELWFMELDATHMEDIVFNATDDNYNYLGGTFGTPQISLMATGNHMYSAFPWALYLDQKFDTSLTRAVWEGARNTSASAALSDSLMGRYGWLQDSAFGEYAVWNFITSTRDDGFHHDEAATYPLATIGTSHSLYPISQLSGPTAPERFAASYLLFYPGASIGTLRIHFSGDPSKKWRVYSIATPSEGVHVVQEHATAVSDDTALIEIPEIEAYLRVALVVVNGSAVAGPGTFSYSADIKLPYAVSSSLVTDSNIYSGGTRKFKVKVSNPSPIPDIFEVSIVDSFGWTTPPLITVAVAAGADTTLSFTVHPPVGTPLGTRNAMHFRSESWGDSTVFHLLDGHTTTVLYRGDCNFSGGVSIVDVTHLVAYLFNGGPAPQPVVLSADFTCSGSVNVVDLTSLVARLFMLGAPCPCNPY